MKHLFIPYELAVIAKEKGFDESCIACYDGSDMLSAYSDLFNPKNYNVGGGKNTSAPTYQQVVDWLESKHNFFFERLMNDDKGIYYILWERKNMVYAELKTIDEAIEKAFKLIKITTP